MGSMFDRWGKFYKAVESDVRIRRSESASRN